LPEKYCSKENIFCVWRWTMVVIFSAATAIPDWEIDFSSMNQARIGVSSQARQPAAVMS
jgi:hypothetical protein